MSLNIILLMDLVFLIAYVHSNSLLILTHTTLFFLKKNEKLIQQTPQQGKQNEITPKNKKNITVTQEKHTNHNNRKSQNQNPKCGIYSILASYS